MKRCKNIGISGICSSTLLYAAVCMDLLKKRIRQDWSVGPNLSLTQVKALLTDMCFSPIIHGIIPE